MKPYGVQFGAGNIGRGFIGHLLEESGLSTVFVEANEDLVAELKRRRSYPIRLLKKDGSFEDVVIRHFEVLSVQEGEAVALRIAHAALVLTAVGARNLPHIAPLVAWGIKRRKEENPEPLNIFLCENLKDAPRVFKEMVRGHLTLEEERFLEEKVGFVGTVIARMVPVVGERFGVLDPLCIVAEAYTRLPFDAKAIKGSLPPLFGFEGVEHFEAEEERKLFFHNLGHAVLAYLGYRLGYAYIHEALRDSRIERVFSGAWQEVTEAFFRKYPFWDREEHRVYLFDLKERFANPAMMDTVTRVGRDPLRKLAPQDRLVGGARFCLERGVFPEHIACGCAAALLYDFPEDEEARKLQEMLERDGVVAVLEKVCGVSGEEELGKRILSYFDQLKRGML